MKKKYWKVITTAVAISMVTTSVLPSFTNAEVSSKHVAQESKVESNEDKLFTKEQQRDLKKVKEKAAGMGKDGKNTYASSSADKSITSLMVHRKSSGDATTGIAYTPSPTGNNPYEGGELTASFKVPLTGIVVNRLISGNGPEHRRNWEQGNHGARLTYSFPEGVDARQMVQTINWEKSNQSPSADFKVRILGVNTLVWNLHWGIKWNRDTITFNPAKPHEFSIMITGKKKSEVSKAEWNSFDPISTAAALTAVGDIPFADKMADMTGSASGALYFDISKYKGNTDDLTKNNELTAGRLFPSKSRNAEYTYHFLDDNALTAGTSGKGDISKSVVKAGHEYDNPSKSTAIPTWDSYLSIWDQEQVYNTNKSESDLAEGEKFALPGKSIFNRNLQVNGGEDFNTFNKDRFNRVINYFTHKDITKGNTGEVSHVDVSHTPNRVGEGETEVTYKGKVSYVNGDVRQLISNNLTVKNAPSTEGTITPDTFTIGDSNITGKYTGDVKRLRLYINGVSVAWGGNLQDGVFTFYAANQKITMNDKVTMNAYDADDNLLKENVPVNLKEASATGSIDPAMYTPGDSNITGTYKGDVVKAKLYVNGNYVSAGGDFSNGVFTYYAGGKIHAGDKAYLIAMDKTGKELERKDIKINASATSGSLNPSAYNVGESLIRGSYTGSVAKMRLLVNGKLISWGGDFSNGSFSYYVKAGTIKAGDNVTLEAYDQNDQKLDSKRVQVKGQATSGSIDSSTYQIGDTTIKGTFSGDITVAKVYINGVAQAWGGDFGGGGFSYYIGKNKIKAGDNVTIEGYSKDSKLLDTKKVTILN
ncbi:hypothetical protein HB852_14095 [Listeria grandensis]|uniref:Bacterial Ig domain-containing protein n=1 Tax=Listeria grandensis TaxID=1494963 RepID=A0A7X1CQ94_9LIST|nr:immunoglobulin-like domain-containing protein [Listeria grandensis]MBC1475743.1 hypothetical protein [Listeria grandensis]MBC1936804.1 hypothetical protein [Listeria grandensis]